MTSDELALRREIFETFAATGAPPDVADGPVLRSLVRQHVVVLDRDGARIRMAHPFAAPRDGARVEAGGRSWWGSCAWDGLGIVAALRLDQATVTGNGVALRVEGGRVAGDAVFHVAVPALDWWEDIRFT